MDTTQWEQPAISIDTVPLQLDKKEGHLKTFIARRKYEPFKGDYALPGVLLSPHERVSEAAFRALTTKASFEISDIKALKVIGVADNPDRDPRGATLSVVNIAIVDNNYAPEDDIVKSLRLNGYQHTALPFDHSNLIRKTVEELHSMFLLDLTVSKALLGDTFRTTDVYNVYREMSAILENDDIIPDLSNLSRNLRNMQHIEKVNKTTETSFDSLVNYSSVTAVTDSGDYITSSGRGRPASLWSWV